MKKLVVDLSAIVRHYISRHRPRVEAEFAAIRAEPSLEAVIQRAGRAQTAAGRRDSHHTRRPQSLLDRAARRLVERLPEIQAAANFARLLEVVTKAVGHFDGLGDLYLYDTALRIAVKKGTLPTRVYLHAGTRAGARKLGLDVKGRKALDRCDLPGALLQLELHEVEDVLCIYKDLLEAAGDLDEAPGCSPRDAGVDGARRF